MNRRLCISLLFIVLLFNSPNADAQIGTWRAYMSYHEPQQIAAAGNKLFVRASNDLYIYNKADQSILTLDRTNGLNDTFITKIAWSKIGKRLVVVYQNSNIDLVDTEGMAINVADLYNKNMTDDKTVNAITIFDRYAFLATNFGVVKLNVSAAEVSETYHLGTAVTKVGVSGNIIYARTNNGVMKASMQDNLIDPNNWQFTSQYDPECLKEDLTDYQDNIDLVKTLNPGGPKYNYFGSMRFKHNRLYTTGGGYGVVYDLLRPGCVQILKEGEWQVCDDKETSEIGKELEYVDINVADAAPDDPNHVFAAGRTGVYEFNNGKFVKHYTYDNSSLLSVFNTDKNYNIVQGLCFDNQGTLWCLNGMVNEALHQMNSEGQWKALGLTLTDRTNENLECAMFDSHGLFWFVNNDWRKPALHCYQPDTGGKKTFSSFTNQDGSTLIISKGVRCVITDRDENLWVGTSQGPLLLYRSEITNDNAVFTQVKVPRYDGTNYADYLLNNVDITCMAIDGAGRKWFGTNDNGVYLISEDNMTQIHHFLTSNSMLLSNTVESIAIDGRTGEVFIGTDKGLCSYMSDATDTNEEMDKNNVWAYPNPVTPEYHGLITITGLSFDADVKIVSANGALINQGRSTGGTYVWNGCDLKGNRVAAGVYMVMTAKSDGKKGTVCKVAIIR